MARALGTQPKLLLLDEPTAGMNPQETLEFVGFVRKVRDELKLTILLIEHDMKLVMGVSERITVLDYGEKISRNPAGGSAGPEGHRGLPGNGGRRMNENGGTPILELANVHTFYGTIQALKGISIEVRDGEIVTPSANGARKSTRPSARSTGQSCATPARSGSWAKTSRASRARSSAWGISIREGRKLFRA